MVCLLIVFNHKYNDNIKILDKIYNKRFSSIYYLVPFNCDNIEGIDNTKIVPVYETSYCFQGYFSQAWPYIKNDKYSHYIIIGDDQILNPKLNERNILEELNIGIGDSYIKNIVPYGQSINDQSNKLYNILAPFRINVGVSYKNELPDYEEAKRLCMEKGYHVDTKLPLKFFIHKGYIHPKHLLLTIVTLAINRGRKLPYPLYKSYADMCIIDSASMGKFCHISGVFAAMGIFVETAIPVAMLLVCQNIKTEKDNDKYYGVENWGTNIVQMEKKFNYSMKKLFSDFGDNVLYYHPVKLSRWKNDYNGELYGR